MWDEHLYANGVDRRVVMATADHDYSRLCCGDRTREQLPAAWAFLLTWGTVPSIYYGDEIGMRYLPGLPDLEGSICYPGYNRAGCRTPMQWDDALPNAGFSDAGTDAIYLPQDPDPARPSPLSSATPTRCCTPSAGCPLRRTTPASAGAATEVLVADTPSPTSAAAATSWWSTPAANPHCRGRRVGRATWNATEQGSASTGRIDADGFGWAIFTLH